MITTCTECQARYQLDAEKIPPRVIKVRCPSCGGVFSLDGNQAKKENVAPPPEPQVTQGGFGDFASEPAAEQKPAAVAQPEVPSAPTPPAAAVPEPETVEPAAPTPVAAEPAAAEPAAAKPAAGVAVMDRPAASSPRRRKSKEEMLARALVSDILVYNRDLFDKAKADGNLIEALGPEIKKSWELYKEKVTAEVANSTNHFRDALNEILAEGENIF